ARRPGRDRPRRPRVRLRSTRRVATRQRVRGLFITGTDTGVGKTVVTAVVVAALRQAGRGAVGLKPVVTGTDEPPDGAWPADHVLLGGVSGLAPGEVNALAYGPPVSPHLAAELA